MAAPKVSVFIPVFNPHPRFFRAAVESILGQSFSDFELILVEDPSPSSGRAILEDIRDARIRHIVNETRTSLPEQHNRGLAESRGAFICRFDADDVSARDRLLRELTFLEEHPDVDVVGSWLRVIDEDDHVVGYRRYPCTHDEMLRAMQRANVIANSSVMFRRGVYERFGGWRTGLKDPAQDYEWYSRLAAGGVRFANVPEPLVDYRLHGGSIKSTQLRGTIRTTLEVKRMYWSKQMSWTSKAVMLLERALLFMPAPLVMRLFRLVRYRR